MNGRRAIVIAALVALAQIAFLGWMIQGRASILRNGQEVLLRVEPVDPRDLLRGDYVRLGYEASEVPAQIVTGLPTETYASLYGRTVFVRLAKQADGYWLPETAALGDDDATSASAGSVVVRGKVSGDTSDGENDRKLFVDYGIERFYVPEGEGLAIEKDMGIRPFGILAAVDSAGNPQIKGLMDGDVMLYAEPLY